MISNQKFRAVNVPFSENFENDFKNLTKNLWGTYRPQVIYTKFHYTLFIFAFSCI